MMSASRDLSAAFGTSFSQQQTTISDRSAEQESSRSGQWPLQNFATPQPYQADSTLTGQNGLNWLLPTMGSRLQTSINANTSTIVLTGMGTDGHFISQMYNPPILGIQVNSSSPHGHQRISKSPQTVKFRCKFVDSAGKACHALFGRKVNLKRHEAVHCKEKQFKCVLPADYKCGKYFRRRDNLCDHYKTHLSTAEAWRHVKFEDLYKYLREVEEPGEAEKAVRTLEKWRERHSPRCEQ